MALFFSLYSVVYPVYSLGIISPTMYIAMFIFYIHKSTIYLYTYTGYIDIYIDIDMIYENERDFPCVREIKTLKKIKSLQSYHRVFSGIQEYKKREVSTPRSFGQLWVNCGSTKQSLASQLKHP